MGGVEGGDFFEGSGVGYAAEFGHAGFGKSGFEKWGMGRGLQEGDGVAGVVLDEGVPAGGGEG